MFEREVTPIKKKTTLLVVALNEIEGMRIEMPKVKREWCEQILVLDGGSTDGTVEYAKQMGYDVYIQKEKGLHNAYQEVWPLLKGDWVITFSPDGNSPPEYIPKLIEKMREGYDMVIGSRYYGGAESDDDDVFTKFGNWLFTRTVNVLFDANFTDVMTIYRIYSKNLFNILELDKESTYRAYEKMFFTKIGVEPILSTRAVKEKLKVGEIFCHEPPRIGGESELQVIRWGLAYMLQIIIARLTPRLLKPSI